MGDVETFDHVVTQAEEKRPDTLAQNVYNEPDMWWIIMHFNRVNDPLSLVAGDNLKIPTKSAARKIVRKGKSVTGASTSRGTNRRVRDFSVAMSESKEDEIQNNVLDTLFYTPPPYQRAQSTLDASAIEQEQESAKEILFNFGFPIPEGFSGLAHFQIQVSPDSDFDNVVKSLMTQASSDNWYFYDHLLNGGAGGFRAIPEGGVDSEVYQGQSVYYSFLSGTLSRGQKYYFRFRVWIDNIESSWFAPPPIIVN